MSVRDEQVQRLYQTIGAYGFHRTAGQDVQALAFADEIADMLRDMNLSGWAYRADEHERRIRT